MDVILLKTAFYGLDTEPELEPEPEPMSIIGTGTVKNSYGSATLIAGRKADVGLA